MDAFGTGCQLIASPGADPVTVQVDIESGLTSQELGERGRGTASRTGRHVIGSLLAAAVPADIEQARLVVDGVRYVLTEPVPSGGEVEFLLLPETASGSSGSKSSTFL